MGCIILLEQNLYLDCTNPDHECTRTLCTHSYRFSLHAKPPFPYRKNSSELCFSRHPIPGPVKCRPANSGAV